MPNPRLWPNPPMAALPLPTTPAERFAWILGALRRAAAGRPALARPAHLAHHVALVLTAPLFRVLWARLGRIAARFARLAARIPPGAPPRASITRPSTTPPRATRALPPAPSLAWLHLPRRPGWLSRVVPPPLCPAASQLRHLLADPAMAALLAASPGLRRTIRPLCRMLALPPPPEPPRPEPPRPEPAAEPPTPPATAAPARPARKSPEPAFSAPPHPPRPRPPKPPPARPSG